MVLLEEVAAILAMNQQGMGSKAIAKERRVHGTRFDGTCERAAGQATILQPIRIWIAGTKEGGPFRPQDLLVCVQMPYTAI